MAVAAVLPDLAIPTSEYRVEIERDWDAGAESWAAARRGGAKTPFQDVPVLEAWYAAMAARPGIDPLLVAIRDARTGEAALHLPLVRTRRGAVRTIGFADFDLVDTNAPIIGPASPRDAAGAERLLRALRRALPPADVLDLRKMPPEVEGVPNPFALLPTVPSRLNSNLVQVGDSFDEYLRGTLKRVMRKEFERSWRVFTRHEGAHFNVPSTLDARRELLAAIEHQQPIRMQIVGKHYWLDEPSAADFYRRLVESDPCGERVVLLCLTAKTGVVAALMGLRHGDAFTMIRVSHDADPVWSNCSPGRLVIIQAMAHLHAEGVRNFDFSVGNFDYKRRFMVEPRPLVDLVRALTPLGLPILAETRAKAWLRDNPALEGRVRHWLRRPACQGS
ncbi:GNAT family N-acetyltransferase [Enterovirga rhinocerotis]|uniref:CelD/BcsL family acetyltransferase involved in cellulose biosynthesis n=1 Tax=Enterovirga rhinocerotis TaxID=1339210 RepID=A0A4R7BSC2_9HYPH|nr:GNAT family N-acetyltransferase [Enterovirga rhinocerotis]TDR88163.1 CelD/BcsL family acetyltransferase involved in cellulose biosynthesis [Enterovirga rhinocerotis]